MKKLLVVAVLVAAGFAAPVVPVSAASTMSKSDADCLIFPMFEKQCWHKAEAMASGAEAAMSAAAERMKVPMMPWGCKPAPAGSGHMFDC